MRNKVSRSPLPVHIQLEVGMSPALALLSLFNRLFRLQTVLKKLVKEIPTDWEGVSKYPVKWKAYAEGFATMGPKLRSWVKKKTGELLGEEEASMVDFVMSHLKDEGSAKKMLASLSPVLDNEAEPFVTRLYRMLIYETLKYSLGLSE